MRSTSLSIGIARNRDLLSTARLFFDTESTWNSGTSLQRRSICTWRQSGVWRTRQPLAVATSNAFVPDLARAYESKGARVQRIESMTLEEIFVANVEHSREEVEA
jgi:hypothetical protein